METPNIPTTDGGKVAVTVVGDADLVDAYLSVAKAEEDKELVQLLRYAEPEAEKAGAVLRRCLEGGKSLIPVYPGNNETPPEGSALVGSIPDGVLYIC